MENPVCHAPLKLHVQKHHIKGECPHFHKVFEKMLQKCGKNERENYFFSTLVFDSKTRSQFRPACKKSERNL